MRKFLLALSVFILVIFGFQAPGVFAQNPLCLPHKKWSPLNFERTGSQLDEKCQKYFVDALPTELVSKQYFKKSQSIGSMNFNPSEAFSLHSRPDANAIIYLDFDGQTWESGMWWINAYGIEAGETSAGFTLDTDPTTFSEIERSAIYEVWANVAEDFAPYDVDVTTERPTGSRESVFLSRGSHALILSEASVQQGCGCGGVAYVDVFGNGNPWQYPALNFSKFGDYYAPSMDVAEIISHEVGHNLGLAHDGTTTGIEYYGGHAMWTPIMGAGRGRGIATWSYGGYPNADTRWDQRAGDDDFAQMSLFMNLLADDHGNDLLSATELTVADLANPISGIITTQTDEDFFEFTVSDATAGLWELQLLPTEYAPNLDAELTLYDSAGTQLSVSNPTVSTPPWYVYITEGLGALIEYDLTPGTYYLSVDGVGQGSLALGTGYDDYASRGNYQLRFGTPLDGVFVESVSPTVGGRGTAVKINGANLNAVTAVSLNGASLSNYIITSNSELVFGIPAGATTGSVIVQSADGPITALETLVVTATASAPTVTSVSTYSGVENQIVTLTGAQLGATTDLKLAGVSIPFTVTDVDSIQFQVTRGMTSGRLSVTTPGGTVNVRGSFTVAIPPTISSITPTTGTVGTTVVITGTYFSSNSEVTFYGGSKAIRPKITSTQITVKVPSGALSGPITVTNPLGSSTSLSNFTVTIPAPTISSFSPTSARVGALVTVNGSNFVNVQSVTLGALSLSFEVVSTSRIRFTVPSGAATARITVTTLYGSVVSSRELRIR